MPPRQPSFPPIPSDTSATVREVFNITGLYITIGDRLETLLADLNVADLATVENWPDQFAFQLPMITIFQFSEKISDSAAADASRARLDWKYALHLPLGYQGFDNRLVCDFRRQLMKNEKKLKLFQPWVTRFAEIGLFESQTKSPISASEVVTTVCTINRLKTMEEAICVVLEELAANYPELLRSIAPAHWYGLYDGRHFQVRWEDSSSNKEELSQSLGDDGLYLLEALVNKLEAKPSLLEKTRRLEQLLPTYYEVESGKARWRLVGCVFCK